MAKVTIIGAGQAGATTAHWLAARGIADLVLLDIREAMARGKALDLMQAMPVIGSDAKLVGTGDYEATAGSDIVVITAGAARKPGMKREDLLAVNSRIVESTVQESLQHSPDAILIVLTNPLDAMSLVALRTSKLPRERVLGQAGILDSARMRCFVAMELGVSVQNVHCYVLGGHGDSMVPLVRHSNVAGVPLVDILPPDRLEAIVERTRKGGAEVINLVESGRAYYAPGASVANMVEAIVRDERRIIAASAYLAGEYGHRDIFLGVPVLLGGGGIEKIIEIELTPEEHKALDESAEHVREGVATLEGIYSPG